MDFLDDGMMTRLTSRKTSASARREPMMMPEIRRGKSELAGEKGEGEGELRLLAITGEDAEGAEDEMILMTVEPAPAAVAWTAAFWTSETEVAAGVASYDATTDAASEVAWTVSLTVATDGTADEAAADAVWTTILLFGVAVVAARVCWTGEVVGGVTLM